MILHGLSRPDFLTDTGLPDLLEATAARQPDRPALYWGELCLSYGELLARASLAAHHLLQAGAAPGQPSAGEAEKRRKPRCVILLAA